MPKYCNMLGCNPQSYCVTFLLVPSGAAWVHFPHDKDIHSICSTCQRAYGPDAAMYDIKQSGILVMTLLRVSLNHTITEDEIILILK